MDSLRSIILLIFCASLVDLLLSYFLYRQRRSQVNKLQFLYWVSNLANFMFNGILAESGPLALSLVIVFPFISNVLQLELMEQIYGLKLKKVPWIQLCVGAVVVTLLAYAVDAPFQVMSAPFAILGALPAFYFMFGWKAVSDKGVFDYLLIGSFLLTGVHMLDYPILRPIPEFAPFGMSIYFLLLFVKSVTLPFLVLAYTQRTQQERLEREVAKKTEELNQINAQVNYSSKMTALGEMAGGIAHEINNPLFIIKTSCDFILACQEANNLSPADLEKEIHRIDETTTRISKIVKSMLVVSRDPSRAEMSSITISEVLDHAYTLVAKVCKSDDIDLRLNVSDDLMKMSITCNSVLISQVILNLLSNAIDAVKELDGEKWIELSTVEVDANRIEFRVTDSGPRIDDETAEKIFQPFFTTKAVGKGTGLGLSLSSKLIEEHGGKLDLDRERDTTSFFFTIASDGPNRRHGSDSTS